MLHSPRTPSAAAISRKHSSSSAIHEALNPTRGIRDEIARRGGTPKNHAKENARQLKVMQEKMRAKKEAQAELAKQAGAKRSSSGPGSAYSHVPSRLYLASGGSGASSPAPASPVPMPVKRRTTFSSTSSSSSSSNGSITAATGSGVRSSTSRTAAPSATATLKKSASSGSLDDNPAPPVDRKTKVGQVPAYLVQRKQEWAKQEEERRQKQIEKETWPPGTVPVPEEERLATLQYLQQSQKELTLELSRFPITLTPASVQKYRRQQEVLSKLREVEKGIEVYSQARVFMAKVDDEGGQDAY